MKSYDPHSPLIFIHVPKTAGSSVREVFKGWFGSGLIPHYFNEATASPPGRDPRFDCHSFNAPVCVYGHFNRNRGFGVTDDYPDAMQFVTILRDPFEMAVSHYFYTLRASENWKDRSRVPKDNLANHLRNASPNMLNHFPCAVTYENVWEVIESYFVEVGVTERLAESLQLIASALGKTSSSPSQIPRVNATERDTGNIDLAELRIEYRERFPLEFAVYDHVRWLIERRINS